MKRVFIIHGWEGYPEEGWFPWLKNELEKKGYEVMIPEMPNTEHPEMDKWIPKVSSLVGTPDRNTYLVGHSIGANTILRYLESLGDKKIGGVVIVAPYFGRVVLESGEAKKIAEPWLNTPLDFLKVKNSCDNFVAIFSDNDEWVPLENKDYFEKVLSSKIIIEHDKGHINGEAGVIELPSALEAVLDFTKN